jgi:flavodoxin
MKSLIVYESVCHGNTEKIAKAMAEVLNADLIKAGQVDLDSLNDYDLIGFGSGIFFGRFHENVFGLISRLPNMPGKKAFIFSTSGQGKIGYNVLVEQKLKEKGFESVGSFACKGYDTYGPFKLVGGISKGRPNDGDIQKARKFAEKLCI